MSRLTEQEQQEIVGYIEADKPLPDKYRFLMFEEKREVELVWNGKTSEVCNIVLPFQVIEKVDEPLRLGEVAGLPWASIARLETDGSDPAYAMVEPARYAKPTADGSGWYLPILEPASARLRWNRSESGHDDGETNEDSNQGEAEGGTPMENQGGGEGEQEE